MVTPNIYHLHGHQLSITYANGQGGAMHSLEYQDASQTLTFNDNQITTQPTDIGTLVTVTTRLTVDSGGTTFTLFVPNVNLPGPNQHVSITTEGILTLHRFSIIPSLMMGQTELYHVTRLTGTAAALTF